MRSSTLRKHGLLNKVISKFLKPIKRKNYSQSKKKRDFINFDLNLNEVLNTLPGRTEKYKYFHQLYWQASPEWLKEHRDYFSKAGRGFGEDAFHAAWYSFFKDFQPTNLLEIGIYRGQVLSLWSLIAKKMNLDVNITGISPFSDAGDAYTKYMDKIDYHQDVISNFNVFKLPIPDLRKGYSTDKEMKDLIASKKWDLIYIDGCHDYEVVLEDFTTCHNNLNSDGFIVMDDSSLYTDYKPPLYSFAGHPGPSKVADQIESYGYREILSVGHNRYFRKSKT